MKCGLLLSGCGFQDGSEIHEAVFSMHILEKNGIEVVPLSINLKQALVVNHLSGGHSSETRNVIEESARISRGNIYALSNYDSSQLDAVVMPGGGGCISSFSDFAEKKKDMIVHQDVAKLILSCFKSGKVLGAVCIAPVLLAKTLGAYNPTLTVGDNNEVEGCLEFFGAKVQKCLQGECVIDFTNKIVTTPAYMYSRSSLLKVYTGIEKMVEAMLKF